MDNNVRRKMLGSQPSVKDMLALQRKLKEREQSVPARTLESLGEAAKSTMKSMGLPIKTSPQGQADLEGGEIRGPASGMRRMPSPMDDEFKVMSGSSPAGAEEKLDMYLREQEEKARRMEALQQLQRQDEFSADDDDGGYKKINRR